MLRVILTSVLCFGLSAFAVTPDLKRLPRGFAPGEQGLPLGHAHLTVTAPPVGPVHSLGEWEDSEAVITLWPNDAYFEELVKRVDVQVLADQRDQKWWNNWFGENKIGMDRVHYVDVATDSIWVRDYGPLWILDGKGQFGAVDNIYNRPRPQDDYVPQTLAQVFNFPLYETDLIHTGGNYYNDGYDNGFSSTLVFKENPKLKTQDVLDRMMNYLGIARYTTSPLGEDITIEHLDTFGKLVAPDTWVFSQFPEDSAFYKGSETMVALLQTLMSPYGTPYKIYRMPMILRSGVQAEEDYRAYINSFISNKTLYYPTYGDKADQDAAKVYQTALPGYEIVGVDADGTEWGDSIHCRSRNLLKRDTIFAFPKISKLPKDDSDILRLEAEIIPAPNAVIMTASVQVTVDRNSLTYTMSPSNSNVYTVDLPGLKGRIVEIGLYVTDNRGRSKWFPATWPGRGIVVAVP